MVGFFASSSTVEVGQTKYNIIKSFPFLAKAMYISQAGVLLDKYGKETEFYNESKSILDLLVKDIQSLFLKTGPICGENAKYITEHLAGEYEKEYDCKVKTIIMKPGSKEYSVPEISWGITMKFIEERRKAMEEYIEEREKIWGVGTTMGVNYHALPLFIWEKAKLYVSVESTICNGLFSGIIQLHVARSQKDMLDLVNHRYGASYTYVVENNELGKRIKNLTGRLSFLEFNQPFYKYGSYKKRQNTFRSLSFDKMRKNTLRGVLRTISKIPIQPRKPLTAYDLMKRTRKRSHTSLRHHLKTQLATPAKRARITKKIRVKSVGLTKK